MYICGKETTSTLNVYMDLNLLNIDFVNNLEIIYIGKSMKDIM